MSEDATSPEAVARSMGLGGDLPPARERPPEGAAVTVRPATETGLEVREPLPRWRRGRMRALIVTVALCFSGYVFAWGDVEDESRFLAAASGGIVFGFVTFTIGVVWWAFRRLIGRPRPFGRAVFNYGLVGAIAILGILGADEFLG